MEGDTEKKAGSFLGSREDLDNRPRQGSLQQNTAQEEEEDEEYDDDEPPSNATLEFARITKVTLLNFKEY